MLYFFDTLRNATSLIAKPRRTILDLQAARDDLKQAITTFNSLSHPKTQVKPVYSTTKAQVYNL